VSFTYGTPVEAHGTAASEGITFTGVPANAALVVYVGWNPGGGVTLNSVVDSVGGALTQVGSTYVSSSSFNGSLWLLPLSTAGSHTVTATLSSANDIYVGGLYVTGAANSPLDGGGVGDSNFAGTSANAVHAPSVTTTQNGDAILSFFNIVSGGGATSAGTSPNAFTSLGFVTTDFFGEYFVQTTAGAIQPTATNSVNSDTICATIALAPGTGVSYSLTASSGPYAITGEAVTLGTNAAVLSAGTGSYAVSGQAATLFEFSTTSFTLLANAGAYDVLGASSSSGYALSLPAGAYAITGNQITLSQLGGYNLPAAVGVYAVTGENATLAENITPVYVLLASSGSFAITGIAATLARTEAFITPGAAGGPGKIFTTYSSGMLYVTLSN